MPPAPNHDPRHDLPPAARRALVLAVLAVHLGGAGALLQAPAAREVVADVAPLMVELIDAPPAPVPEPAPPAPPPPPPPPAPPPPKPRAVVAPRKPPPPTPRRAEPPVVAARTPPAPAPRFTAPAPPPVEFPPPVVQAPAPEPALPEPTATEPTAAPPPAASPPASPALAAAPAPAAPAPPRTISATAVQYRVRPAPDYPAGARRLRESGRVLVRVEIDTAGLPRQVQLLGSSGSPRLDEAALSAVRAARFHPYTEDGVPRVVWSTVPIVFELEN